MKKRCCRECNTQHPAFYQIRVIGHLDDSWSQWFDGLDITLEEDGETIISGPVLDQPELHGLLKKINDLGLHLLSVEQMECSQQINQQNAEEEVCK